MKVSFMTYCLWHRATNGITSCTTDRLTLM